jgi:hypothetical protein
MQQTELKENYTAIEKLAYELWESRGCPLGSPEVDWYAAAAALATNSNGARKHKKKQQASS